jgi:hypothetical protein
MICFDPFYSFDLEGSTFLLSDSKLKLPFKFEMGFHNSSLLIFVALVTICFEGKCFFYFALGAMFSQKNLFHLVKLCFCKLFIVEVKP